MKTTLAWTTIAAALAVAAIGAPSLATAADINVVGADANANVDVNTNADATTTARAMPATSMRGAVAIAGAPDAPDASDAARAKLNIKIASKDILNKPTALINKNTLATDNNVFVSRSNILFSQSDRLALAKKVEQLVTSSNDAANANANTNEDANKDASDMTTAVLAKNVLRAVSGSDTDAALMTKASAVVAAKDDPSARGMRITDLVNTVFDAKRTQEQTQTEQSIQTDTPRGVILMIGTKDILRQPTGVVNKNAVVSDSQMAVARSNIAPSQNDNVALGGNAKMADAVLPASAINVKDVDTSKTKVMAMSKTKTMDESASGADYRVGFLYSKSEAAATSMTPTTDNENNKEQLWGLGGAGVGIGGLGGLGGLGFGWRYPLGYWNSCGASLYGAGGCGLGLAYGSFYYC